MSEPTTKRFLVTGGAGFIGSHLCERLVQGGHLVVCLDNFSTGRPANVAQLAGARFTLVEHDVITPWRAPGRLDAIFNLACAASPKHYQADPVHTLKTSVLGMLNLLELARAHGCPIVQASTSEVYGDPRVHPQPESYCGNVNPIGPRACYDEGKRAAETLCFDFARCHGVQVKVARIFNTYGPRMDPDDGRIVANFIGQALAGRPLTIYGDGRQTRSLCYVSDLVDGLLALAASPPEVTGPINLGNPAERAVIDIARLVLDLTGSPSAIGYRPLPADDPQRRCPVIDRARAVLGWAPTIDLEAGLRATIASMAPTAEPARRTGARPAVRPDAAAALPAAP